MGLLGCFFEWQSTCDKEIIQLEPCTIKEWYAFLPLLVCQCCLACQLEKGDTVRDAEICSTSRLTIWSLHQKRSGHGQQEDFGKCNKSLHLRLGKGPKVDNRGILVHLGLLEDPPMDNRGILVHRGIAFVAMYIKMQLNFDLSWASST